MRNLKKLAALMMAVVMVFAMTACGAEQSLTVEMVQDASGVTVTDTITMDAKGDIVQKMTEKIVVDISGFDATQKEAIAEIYDELVVMYQSVEGVECTGTVTDDSYTMDIVIDATGSAPAELAEQGLLQMEGNSDRISLKSSKASFEASGYTVVE